MGQCVGVECRMLEVTMGQFGGLTGRLPDGICKVVSGLLSPVEF